MGKQKQVDIKKTFRGTGKSFVIYKGTKFVKNKHHKIVIHAGNRNANSTKKDILDLILDGYEVAMIFEIAKDSRRDIVVKEKSLVGARPNLTNVEIYDEATLDDESSAQEQEGIVPMGICIDFGCHPDHPVVNAACPPGRHPDGNCPITCVTITPKSPS